MLLFDNMLHANDYKQTECLEEAAIRFIRSKYIDCNNRPSRQDQKPIRFKFARNQAKSSESIYHNHKLFNVELGKLNLSPVRLADDVVVRVPFFLALLVDEVRLKINIEGILRKSGSLARQVIITENISNGNFHFTDCNPLDLCGILKRFIRNIPGGLIPIRLHESFLGTLKHFKATEECDPLLGCCLLLPRPNLHVLIFLMRFLSEVAMEETTNLMTVDNLATIFAPTLFVKDTDNKTVYVTNSPVKTTMNYIEMERIIVALLIKNSYRIGYIPRQIEKSANELHEENQEMALKRARCDSNQRKSHWRSLSTKNEHSKHSNQKKSTRNRSLFSRKIDTDNTIKGSSGHSSKSLITFIRKSKVSLSPEERSIINSHNSSPCSSVSHQRYSVNSTTNLSVIAENSIECDSTKDDLNIAIIEEEQSDSEEAKLKKANLEIANFRFKPLFEDPMFQIFEHSKRPITSKSANKYAPSKKGSNNPLLYAYRNCNPDLRKQYLRELMRDVVSTPLKVEPSSGVPNWIKKRKIFKSGKFKASRRAGSYQQNRGTPV